MNTERKRVLTMLGEGKITADEAEELLAAIDRKNGSSGEECCAPNQKKPKFFCVKVAKKSGNGETVNVRIPLGLVRAGMKLGALMPLEAQGKVNAALADKGFCVDIKTLSGDEFEQIVQALTEMSIDVGDDRDRVQICCE